jgi:phytoene synthase
MSTETIENEFAPLTDMMIERGYKNCVSLSRKFFAPSAWVTANLPADNKRAIAAMGWHLIRCIDFLDLESFDGLSLDIWKERLYELSDALGGQCRCPQDAALADAVNRFGIPKEHLFEMMTAADSWSRTRKFQTCQDMELFSAKFGGSMLAACAPILGATDADYLQPAIQCGAAITMTQMLANLVPNLKQHQAFYPVADVQKTGVSITRTMMRQSSPQLKQFVRLQTSRIEKLFVAGGQIVPLLDFGGKRTMSSMLDYYWAVFSKMRAQPDSILQPTGVLSQREKFALRTRHLMGTEGKAPIIAASHGHH